MKSKGRSTMKSYATATDALIDYFRWLDSRGEFNSATLAKKIVDAGVPPTEQIGESMIRMLRRGVVSRLTEHRAVAACRVFGIQVAAINAQIPDGWTAPKSKAK
jgi:hypothetical protein